MKEAVVAEIHLVVSRGFVVAACRAQVVALSRDHYFCRNTMPSRRPE